MDKFHAENTYLIALADRQLADMITLRAITTPSLAAGMGRPA